MRVQKDPSQSYLKVWGVDTPILQDVYVDQPMKSTDLSPNHDHKKVAPSIPSRKKESSKALEFETPNHRSPQVEEALHVGPVPQVTSKVLNLRKQSVKRGW